MTPPPQGEKGDPRKKVWLSSLYLESEWGKREERELSTIWYAWEKKVERSALPEGKKKKCWASRKAYPVPKRKEREIFLAAALQSVLWKKGEKKIRGVV